MSEKPRSTTVLTIFRFGRPPEVLGSIVAAISVDVIHFMFRSRRRSMERPAQKPVEPVSLTLASHIDIAICSWFRILYRTAHRIPPPSFI